MLAIQAMAGVACYLNNGEQNLTITFTNDGATKRQVDLQENNFEVFNMFDVSFVIILLLLQLLSPFSKYVILRSKDITKIK